MEVSDLSKVCRLCLKGGEVMCPIFGASQLNGNTTSLPHRIMSCAQVKVFEGDGLPTNVCTACLTQVDRSYQFKLLCEKSDSTLRGNIHGRNSASDTESLDGGDSWDMMKFTPEVIINEEGDENNIETNGSPEVSDNYYPLSQVEAILRHHGTEIKVQGGEVMIPMTNGFEAFLGGEQGGGQVPQPSPQSLVPPQVMPSPVPPPPTPAPPAHQQPAPGPSPKSRRCRGGDKLFKCRQCNKSYSFSSALSRHKAVHNTALRPHVCNICNKGFTQLDKLLRHQKTHSLDMIMTCDMCTKTFKTFAAYQKHRLLGNCIDGSMSRCEKCLIELPVEALRLHTCGASGASTAASAGLPTSLLEQPPPLAPILPHHYQQQQQNQQMQQLRQEQFQQQQMHTLQQQVANSRSNNGKGKPEFRCNVCHKNFATRGSLDVHSTIHTGLRPFVCSVCDKSFRHKVNLMEHFQRKHSQVRPYICDICAARFVTKQELVRHYRKHIGD